MEGFTLTEPDKFILDACCGGKMFWFNKQHPNALYIDIRTVDKGHIQGGFNPNHEVKPDMIMDFRSLEFQDKTFKVVVFDPPHLTNLTETSIMRKKFGCLNAQTWQSDIKLGFKECWRVLEDYGVLIFKWCDIEIPLSKVLELAPAEPLFGHSTGTKERTKWLTFMKIPQAVNPPTLLAQPSDDGGLTRGFQASEEAQIPAGTSESPIIVSQKKDNLPQCDPLNSCEYVSHCDACFSMDKTRCEKYKRLSSRCLTSGQQGSEEPQTDKSASSDRIPVSHNPSFREGSQ